MNLHNVIKSQLIESARGYGPNRDQTTAAGAYDSFRKVSQEHLDKIAQLLSQENPNANWGDVGSIGLLHDQLKSIIDHYSL